MTLIALNQICDQLKEAIGLDDEHNVAALIDEDCDTEVKGWTIVSVSNSGEIKPCTSQSFSTIKELMYSWLEKQGKLIPQYVYPKFRIGDTIRLKGSVAEYTITSISSGCYHGKGWGLEIKSEKDYELVEPKREWSEEDAGKLALTIRYLELQKHYQTSLGVDYIDGCISFLKSQSLMVKWKPSGEQMKALWDSIPENVKEISEREMLLDSLYQDLKKLTE